MKHQNLQFVDGFLTTTTVAVIKYTWFCRVQITVICYKKLLVYHITSFTFILLSACYRNNIGLTSFSLIPEVIFLVGFPSHRKLFCVTFQ